MDDVRATVNRLQRSHLAGQDPDSAGISTTFQEGVCPYSGEGYLSVTIWGFDRIDIRKVYTFQQGLQLRHPRKDEEVVSGNMDLRLEEDWPELDEQLFDAAVTGPEVLCWVCGRGDGDTYYPPESEQPVMLTIDVSEDAEVPLCTICNKLFLSRNA
jgi:hypothetical protein